MPSVRNATSVDADDSFEHWHEVTCRNYSVSEFRRDSDAAFCARISIREFGALALTDASSTAGAAALLRGAAEIRKDPRDHFMLYLVTEGGIGVAQDGREAQAEAGDLFLYDQTRPLTLRFQPRYDTVMLNIPRALLEQRLARTGASTARRIAGSTKLGTFAGMVVRQLGAFGAETSSHIVDRLAGCALDVVATALDGEGLEFPLRHRLLARVQAYLLANLHDSRLEIETIANALHVAPRTLNRLFAAEGTTPMRWLWQQRLAASKRALTEGRARSVTDASLSFGFRDVSHFSRAFKATFGTSPRAFKRD